MLDGGDGACAMEVSSHALVLGRADAIHFDAAAFTNLTQDHLDFHADMEDYFAAKRLLFSGVEGGRPPATAVVNVDDAYGAGCRELATARPRCVTFSAARRRADLSAERRRLRRRRRPLHARRAERRAPQVALPLPGPLQRRERARRARRGASRSGSSPTPRPRRSPRPSRSRAGWSRSTRGRTSRVLVDYAHTPDSLENVLRAARRLTEGG